MLFRSTRNPFNEPPTLRADAGAGSLRHREGSVAVSRAFGDVAVLLNAAGTGSEGYRINNELRQRSVVAELRRAVGLGDDHVHDPGLAAADQGRQALEASTRQADVEMTFARERAAGLVTQAEQRMSQMIDEAKNAAREESNREKAAAKAEIEQEVLRAKEALREQVAALAIAGAEKILRREINAQAHADLLNQLKQELK